MLSIGRALDEHDIATQIRLERQSHKGSFLLVEGQTDMKRFGPLIDDIECSLVNCYFKSNAVGAIQLLSDDGFQGAVAVVDADFDRLNGTLQTHEGIFYSERHDFDLDWIDQDVVDKYFGEVADPSKISAAGGSQAVVASLKEALRPVSTLRYLNATGAVKFRLKDIDLANVFDSWSCSIDKLVDEVFKNHQATDVEKKALAARISTFSSRGLAIDQLTNGHDFCIVVGLSLRSAIGSRRAPQTWGSEVETHIRLCFSRDSFRRTKIYRDLKSWEKANAPFIVLDPTI